MAATAVFVLGLPILPLAADQPAEPRHHALAAITISFKQGFRVSGGTYGGERWSSRPVFTSSAQAGSVGTVDVRVRGVDVTGRPIEIVPEWTPGDPERVSVAPGPKGGYRITVKGAGESTLTVASQGLTRTLAINAISVGKSSIQVRVTQ
jgi:hypothetical protein